MKNSLLLRLFRLKHASHDQSTHGRRGSGGGADSAIMGARPKPKPGPGQTTMFDVFDTERQTTPQPEPAARSSPPNTQQTVTATPATGDFTAQPLNDLLARIDATSLPDDAKRRLRNLAQQSSEVAKAIHARRDELYTGDPVPDDVRYQMFTEAFDMAAPLAANASTASAYFYNEIAAAYGESGHIFDPPDKKAPLINAVITEQRAEHDALLVESTRLAMLQRDPAPLSAEHAKLFNTPAPPELAEAVHTVSKYLHVQPQDNTTVLISPVYGRSMDQSQNIRDSHYNEDRNYISIGMNREVNGNYVPADTSDVQAVATHELGHWIEHAKFMSQALPGQISYDSATATTRKLFGNEPDVVRFVDDTNLGRDFNHRHYGTGRKIPYANLIYSGKRRDGTEGINGTEGLSTTLEFLFGTPGLREQDSKLRSVVLMDQRVIQYTIGMMSY